MDKRSGPSRAAASVFRHRGSAVAGFVVRQAFGHASRALPLRRVAESQHVLAFHHPVPGFEPVHLLLVPKLPVRSVMQFTDVQRDEVSAEVEVLAREALDRLEIAQVGFLVVVNGGIRQDVRQVHFHLLTEGYDLALAPSDLQAGIWIDSPDPSCAVHQVRSGPRPLRSGLIHAVETRDALQLERRGYSVVWDARARDGDALVHLTVGEGSRA
jgi:diadenosine tetraphosphate (Ap4A) HIT family hydrolase